MSLSFIEDYLPLLPHHVILQIIDQLPLDHIIDFFLQNKKSTGGSIVRSIIIEEYFSKELHFIVSPTRRPYFSSFPLNKRHFITFKTYFEIKKLLDENPDIIPQKLLLISGGDFNTLQDLMAHYRERFAMVEYLDITLESSSPIASENLQFLLSFDNLRKLHCSSKLIHCKKVLNKVFDVHPSLEEIVLLGHGISNWSSIKFPQAKLRLLDISWTQSIDVLTIDVPQSTQEIYWNMSNISDPIFSLIKLPMNLRTLMLTYNKLNLIDISKLPRTLENLDLSHNQISSVEDSVGNGWPQTMKSLLFSSNHINNDSLLKLSQIGWPKQLNNLILDNNPFTKLSSLFNLPSDLQFLNLSHTAITSLSDGNALYEFPAYLTILRLANCKKLTYSEWYRVKFPIYLTDLDLTECNILSLEYFEFPKGLEKLALLGNQIEDLNSYEQSSTSHTWQQLSNLVELDLFSNCLTSLNSWNIPHQLKRLDLRLNKFTEISAKSMSLFNAKFPNALRFLNLSQNSISLIDAHISVPPELRILLISENLISGVLSLPDSLGQLQSLDISGNYITGIEFSMHRNDSSRLKLLDLSGNLLFKKTGNPAETRKNVAEFYDALETGLGIKVKLRKFNVNGQHQF